MMRTRVNVVSGAIVSALMALANGSEAQPAARLRGVVFDSVARAPLANASVRVFRADSASVGIDARTDATGTFEVSALRTGTWLLSFLHPRLDSLRLEPPVARVDVVEAGEIDVTLAAKSGESFSVQGSVVNEGQTAGSWTMKLELLDETGAVVASKDVAIGPVEPGSGTTFSVKIEAPKAVAFRYAPIK